MILFMDDDPARAALAYQRMKPEDRDRTIWCRTAKEAIITLKDYKNSLTAVMLDHDLEGESFVNSKRDDCGMEVVRVLEKMNKENSLENLTKVKFIVHTWNIEAGLIMEKRLREIGLKVIFIPFGL